MSSTNSDLKTWAQERITALWSAPDESAFHSEFERTFAPSECTKLTVNKEGIDRENYKNELQKLRAPMVRADIEFNDIDILDSSGEDSGTIKGSFTVKRSLKFRVRAAPAQRQRIINFTAVVENSGDITGADNRRIVFFEEDVEDKPVPVNLNSLAHNSVSSGETDTESKTQ